MLPLIALLHAKIVTMTPNRKLILINNECDLIKIKSILNVH